MVDVQLLDMVIENVDVRNELVDVEDVEVLDALDVLEVVKEMVDVGDVDVEELGVFVWESSCCMEVMVDEVLLELVLVI